MFRRIVPDLRERYLNKRNAELREILLDESATPTDQFWSVGERVDEIVKILRSCFDGHSRSRMMHYLMIMYRHGILTEGDMEGFSEEARGRLERYIGFLKEDARQDG